MKIPLNRIIAFAGPYISIFSGAVATWLLTKMNVLGIQGLDHDKTALYIASGLTFGLTSLLTWLGHSKWLQGHHIDMESQALLQATAIEAQAAVTQPDATGVDPDHDDLIATSEDLPSDETEFASPPPDETNTPVQPSQSDSTHA